MKSISSCLFFPFLFFLAFAKTSLHAQPAQKEYDEAKSAYYDGHYKKAETLFLKSYNVRIKELGEENELTQKSLYRLAKTYGKLRENEKALEHFQSALKIAEKLHGPESKDAVDLYQEIGNIYNQMYEPEKGNTAYAVALSRAKKIYGDESKEVSGILMNIGTSYHKMAAYHEAEKYYLQSFALIKKTARADSESFNRIYSNMGYLYRKMGDYEKALEYGRKALEIKLLNYGAMHPSVAKYHRNIGKALEGMGRHEEALPYMERAVEISEKSLGREHPNTGGAYGEMAQILANMGEYEAALKWFRKGLRILEKKQPTGHPYVVAGYFNIATVYADQKKWDEALKYFRINLKKFLGRSYRPLNLIAMTYHDIAEVFYEKNEMDSALIYCQMALGEISNGFSFSGGDYFKNPPLESVQADLLFLKILNLKSEVLFSYTGQNDFSEKYLEETLHTVQVAVRLIERIRKGFNSDASRQYLNDDTGGLFKIGLRSAIKLYQKTGDEKYLWQAFEISEKNKAGILWRSVNEGSAMQSAGIPLLEKEKTEKLERQLAGMDSQLQNAEEKGDSAMAANLRSDIFDIHMAYENQLQKLEKEYPGYYELKYAAPVFSKNKMTQKLSEQNAAMIEYFYDDTQFYIFFFNQNGLTVHTVEKMNGFEKVIKKMRGYNIANLSHGGSIMANESFLRDLENLYGNLIRPLNKELIGHERLVIIPHGILNYLPFEMLIEKAEGTDFRKQKYLLQKYTVQYAWSAALWEKEPSGQEETEIEFAGFAPSYEQTATTDMPAGSFRSDLTELTYSESEITQANSFFNGQVFSNRGATESAFCEVAPHSHILHLAAHALIDDERPLHSGLAFSTAADTLSDAFLHAHEIYHMRLPAELAVMSACNTGYGQLAEGEGVMSLGRAFFYAGCRSVIMSQWLANDQSTSKLMACFYRHIAEGKPKDEALRLAKLDFLAQADALTAHPYFWAGMVAVGDMRPIKKETGNWPWWWIGGAAVFGVFLMARKKLV